MLVPPWGLPPGVAQAQSAGSPAQAEAAYSPEQLDALLAPIALYPDDLLTQVLMASAWPLQVVEAERWLSDPANAALQGDALAAALAPMDWDPAVKSLVPFPAVVKMMNDQLEWMQQLGYAFASQQAAVLASVQRLRSQAQASGHLASSRQQVVSVSGGAVIIAPANPQVVYVPVYNPAMVYGVWPCPDYPPVYLPPPPGYDIGDVLATGIAFGVGAVIIGSLWGIGSPNWGGGGVYVNVNRWNAINRNRPPISNPGWRPPPPSGGGGWRPPPGGPVGRPNLGGSGGFTGVRPGGAPAFNPQNRPAFSPAPQEPRSMPPVFSPTPQAPRPGPQGFNPAPQGFNPAPQAPRSAPQGFNPAAPAPRSAPQVSRPEPRSSPNGRNPQY
jgi:hypothetical protein